MRWVQWRQRLGWRIRVYACASGMPDRWTECWTMHAMQRDLRERVHGQHADLQHERCMRRLHGELRDAGAPGRVLERCRTGMSPERKLPPVQCVRDLAVHRDDARMRRCSWNLRGVQRRLRERRGLRVSYLDRAGVQYGRSTRGPLHDLQRDEPHAVQPNTNTV